MITMLCNHPYYMLLLLDGKNKLFTFELPPVSHLIATPGPLIHVSLGLNELKSNIN